MSDYEPTVNPEPAKESREESEWTWVNVYDWQVEEHTNQETGDKWWDVKLASGTFIEVDGEKIDASKHHFSVNWAPAVTYGEPGTPRCTRGVHLPNDWEVTLKRFENIAKEGHAPVFEEVGRIEKVTPQQLAEGVDERNSQWRAAHRKPRDQEQGHDAQEQKQPGRGMYRPRSAEPAL